MGKASRRKHEGGDSETGADQGPAAPPPGWAGPTLAAAALVGLTVSAVATWVHHQVRSSLGTYTSFCNYGETFNCDRVLTSGAGYLFSVPVSVWGMAFYAVLGFVALRIMTASSPARDRARGDAFTLALGGALFSLYLATVALFSIGTLCLLCLALYAVSAVALAAAFGLARPRSLWSERLASQVAGFFARPLLGLLAGAGVGAVLFLPRLLGEPVPLDREEIARREPKFYDWYISHPVVEVPREGAIASGPTDAPITIVEFADFQCGACAMAHERLKELLPTFPDKIRYVFRAFPLSSECNPSVPRPMHEDACEASVAAYCAAREGKEQPYMDLLFANQAELPEAALVDFAKDVGLEADAFRTCLASAEAKADVDRDVHDGRRLAVAQTPTFFINGRRVPGVMTPEYWRMALALELDDAS